MTIVTLDPQYSRGLGKEAMLCHKCFHPFFPDEVVYYEPAQATAMPDFYKEIIEAACVCPWCDAPLDEENQAIYENYRNSRDQKA